MTRRHEAGARGRAKGSALTAEDVELWRAATRHDRPLPGRDYRPPEPGPSHLPPAEPPPPRAPARPRAGPPLPELSTRPMAGLDKHTARKLKRGQLAIEGRLDLHGLTQAEAHGALAAFLAAAQGEGKRCVLVITGKGARGPGESGVLRTMAPRWLDEPANRRRIIAICPARPEHGGGGALYVLLRKRR